MTNVLVLAANDATDPSDAGYPVCLTELGNSTLLEVIATQVQQLENVKLTIALRDADVRKWHFDELVKNFPVSSDLYSIGSDTAGATCTALLAVASMDEDDALLILNGNEFLDFDFASAIKEFSSASADAGVVCFDSLHPRYSYARLDDQGYVLETAEKRPISRNATVGFYWFKSAGLFLENASRQLLKRATVDGKYFICPVMNEVILSGGLVKAIRIDQDKFVPLKTQRQLSKFEASKDI
jgi:dTDP-glucose pyrophosphorylase